MIHEDRHRYMLKSESGYQDALYLVVEPTRDPNYMLTLWLERRSAVAFVKTLADFVQLVLDKIDEAHELQDSSFYDTFWHRVMVEGREEKQNDNEGGIDSLPF